VRWLSSVVSTEKSSIDTSLIDTPLSESVPPLSVEEELGGAAGPEGVGASIFAVHPVNKRNADSAPMALIVLSVFIT